MPEVYGKSKVGKGTFLGHSVVVGHPGKNERALLTENRLNDVKGAVIGKDCVIRDGTIIYSQTTLGDNVQTGHNALIREDTTIGNKSMVGTLTIIEDNVTIGERVSIQSAVYIPTNTVIEDDVFIGPRVCFTNDKYMGRGEVKLLGAHVEKNVRIGANSTILPGIRIGCDALVGAGAVVTKDVEPYTMVAGVPARKVGMVPVEHRRK
ncbi:MAG: acyltransferase [Thermoplasmata archaeon]|nr:acyltransferase [Thermoplasmata archaeon]